MDAIRTQGKLSVPSRGVRPPSRAKGGDIKSVLVPRSLHVPGRRIGSALCVLAASTCFAVAAPPTPQDCADPDLGARIRCKAGNVLDQQQETTRMLSEMPEIPEKRRRNLTSQTQRSMQVHGRSGSDEFKLLAKKKNPSCQIAEIENDGKGDDDGVCKGQEDCLERIGDQIGDDVQPCKRAGNPKEREMCVEICDNEAIESDPDNFDETGRGPEIEAELDDVTEEYMVLNERLEEAATLRAASRILFENGDPCSTMFGNRIAAGLLWASLGGKLLIEGITDVHDKFCNQDVGGFNGATACAWFEVVKAVAVSQFEILDNIDGNRDSDTIDTTFACLKTLNTSVGESNDALESIETKVDGIDQRVMTLQRDLLEVMTLLKTPLGRREGFPKSK